MRLGNSYLLSLHTLSQRLRKKSFPRFTHQTMKISSKITGFLPTCAPGQIAFAQPNPCLFVYNEVARPFMYAESQDRIVEGV